ncbi:MAG: hypothetical protein IM584_04645 [Chitinophagaceae bacterium]|jgi:hypothetical protein|nr:hypothetical protein [Chitinophagaceae bacterium]MCA6459044.1 hypothetical protein [Chitinophagaceae bacterium]MCA6465574.1 hypothetical protein [Chitinophagaceae bacterium]
MNKKDDPSQVLTKRATIRYTESEYKMVKDKAADSGKSFSDYCREVTIKGYVQAVRKSQELNEIREFRSILIQYKSNFSRISNLILNKDPRLNSEILKLKDSLQLLIENIRL